MKDPKLVDNKVVFGPCRLSYVHLLEKYVSEGDTEGKYSCTVLIPKSEKKTLDAINKAIECAKKQGIVNKFGGKEPRKLELPLHDGNEKDGDEFQDHFYVNAKCKTKPGVVDKNLQNLTDEEEVYSGMWAYVSVTFFAYDVLGNKGIACGLNNVKKFKDDDNFGGRVSAEADFGNDFDDDDDDL